MGDIADFTIPVIGTAINAWSQERNLEENANQARIQREWQEEMWNKNNEYNTPLAQKARLEAAGINPYSVLAQGGANTGISSSPAQTYERMKANIQSPMNPDAFYNAQISSAQSRGLRLDNDLKATNLEFARSKAINEVLESMARQRDLLANARKSGADADYIEENLRLLQARYDSLVQQSENDARISKIDAGWRYQEKLDNHLESVLRRQLSNSNINVNRKTIEKLASDIATNVAQVGYLGSMAALNEKSIEKLASDVQSAIRERVSSRFHDKLAQEKFEFDVTIDVLKTVMEANGVTFGNLKFRGVQNKIKDVLKENFPNLVKTNAIDDFFSTMFGEPSVNVPQHGGVR